MVFWSELCNCAFCTLPCTSLPVDAVIVNNIDSDSCVLIDNDILILKLIYTGYNCKKKMHGTLLASSVAHSGIFLNNIWAHPNIQYHAVTVLT